MSVIKLRSVSSCQNSRGRPQPDTKLAPSHLVQAIAYVRMCACDLTQPEFCRGRSNAAIIIALHLRFTVGLRKLTKADSVLWHDVLVFAYYRFGYPAIFLFDTGSQVHRPSSGLIRCYNFLRIHGKLAGHFKTRLIACQLIFRSRTSRLYTSYRLINGTLRLRTELILMHCPDMVLTELVPLHSHNKYD